MKHVAPHKWNDAWAGRLDDAEVAAMEQHAAACAACTLKRERVTRASDSFASIRSQATPEIGWDSVRARVHWSVSTEKRAKVRAPLVMRPRLLWAFGAIAVAAGAVGVASQFRSSKPIDFPTSAPPVAVTPPVAPAVAPSVAIAQLSGLVSRSTGDVTIDGAHSELFAHKLGAGTKLATGDGRVDVQFGDASAFALGPRSSLEIRRFDAQAIELAIEGTIDVEVAPRAPGQRFLVIAGDRTVEVRGTQFRVSHDGAGTVVACRHGLVAVRDGHGQLEVAAARQVDVHPGHAVADEHVVALSADELGSLARATPLALPGWAADPSISAPLEIATASHREVRVDGIELGLAPLQLRVMPGRHTVEVADQAGRYRRAGWVDVGASHAGRFEVPTEVVPSAGIAERRQQFKAGIDRKRLALCVRPLSKQGLSASIQIDIAIDASGAVDHLNALENELAGEPGRCVLEVLRDVRFAAGTAATWRERIDL